MPTTRPFCRDLALGVKVMLTQLPSPTRKRVIYLVLGILLAQSVVLRRIASAQRSYFGGSTTEASHERRLRRILSDPVLTWGEVYAPAVKQVLRWQRAKRLLLLIDESGHSEVLRLLKAAVWYRNRAIPLGWVSWPAQQPLERSYWHYVEQLLPSGPRIVVLADRAFGNPAFIDRVAARGWDWLVRVQHQTCFRDAQGRCILAHQECLLVGMAFSTLVVLCLGNQVANELLAQQARPRRSRAWHSKHSLFRLGLDRLRARLNDTVQTPLVWALEDFEAPGWQKQLCQRDATAFVWSQPLHQAA